MLKFYVASLEDSIFDDRPPQLIQRLNEAFVGCNDRLLVLAQSEIMPSLLVSQQAADMMHMIVKIFCLANKDKTLQFFLLGD